MRLKFIKNLVAFLLFTAMVLAISVSPAFARGPDDGFSAAKKIETRYFSVSLASGVDEPALIQSLNIGPEYNIFSSLNARSGSGASFSINNLGDLLDGLFEWACGIMDMNLYSYRGSIKIAREENDLKVIYQRLYGQEGYSEKGFYIAEVNTLYIAAPDFTKEILGHEMGHAIISSFFVVQPPAKVQEVLAGYIEYQLRKVKKPR
ncbi:MAG: hypothetical protein HQL16_02450 [Candidatus Omnitrophica bacterium]|nr:hypothetical protein [Candidatus Omnitrophota bacterium]